MSDETTAVVETELPAPVQAPKVELPTPAPVKQTFKYRIDAEDVTRLDEFSVPPDQIIVDVDMNWVCSPA